MIGELKNRLTHLLEVKTDAEIQGDFIKFLKKEVEIAAFTDIEDFPFVKWLDDELSYLVFFFKFSRKPFYLVQINLKTL
ncbi:PROTEIN CHUP1 CHLOROPLASTIC-LIKE [Salix purpurea]|uniref:PROTEIN CHUP1 CHLOROPLASTIC-LIKE n=1 Tax=Salix purpurea TaxID=77065 RepID=A0A9Q0WH69_SALPP|nr:PROTEIN CHUP1 CHLOROPLASTIC-LIKE [Salix purpurea]